VDAAGQDAVETSKRRIEKRLLAEIAAGERMGALYGPVDVVGDVLEETCVRRRVLEIPKQRDHRFAVHVAQRCHDRLTAPDPAVAKGTAMHPNGARRHRG
jgi:hypothetical protein